MKDLIHSLFDWPLHRCDAIEGIDEFPVYYTELREQVRMMLLAYLRYLMACKSSFSPVSFVLHSFYLNDMCYVIRNRIHILLSCYPSENVM